MSKKAGLKLTLLTIFLIIFYLAYDFIHAYESVAIEFMSSYLSSFQTYFFVFTLILIPIIVFDHTPFLSVEYLIRIKEDVLSHVMKEMFLSSLKYTAIIYFFFVTSSFLMRFTFSFELEYMRLFILMFIFILTCFLLFYTVYLSTANFLIGIKVLLFANFVYISTIMSINFMIERNLNLDLISLIYLFLISLTHLSYLIFKLNKKEWFS
ncbi:MAG: hypothetical protein FWG67_04090 [Defluviitaleaceae bacterium]|nr:hypothetical protein [Defluviitaleaceae bacterium]